MKVEEYLQSKGFDYSPSGSDQFVVKVCPFCGDEKGHFYIHREAGLWDCKKCFRTGNLYTLKRELDGEEAVSSLSRLFGREGAVVGTVVDDEQVKEYCGNLWEDVDALKWLKDRGLSRDTIRKFRLGVDFQKSGRWLTIPYFRDGVVVNVKFRSLPPLDKTFQLLPDHDTPLYNVDSLMGDESGTVYVTEGELDALMMCQNEFSPVVSVPLGASSFLPEHYDTLLSADRIVLLFDSDSVGKAAAKKVAKRLNPGRCYIVTLPEKDVTDFFRWYGREDLLALVEEAPRAGKSQVQSVVDVFDEIAERELLSSKVSGDIRMPWETVDEVVGPLEPGYLVGVLAAPKMGKTTFALNLVYECAKRSNIPGLFICLEMRSSRLLMRLVANCRGMPIGELTRDDLLMAKAVLWRLPIYFGGGGLDLTAEKVFDVIRYAVRRLGVRIVVFDNLHFLCRNPNNVTQEVGFVARGFKLLAEELSIVCVVILQPRKLGYGTTPGMWDARDSSSLPADVDVMLTLYRRTLGHVGVGVVTESDYESSDETFEERTLVKVIATRWGPGGSAVLRFNGSLMRFEQYD